VNGAQALIGSLTGAGVDVCFMNPGTSEMHFVGALDSAVSGRGSDPARVVGRRPGRLACTG